MRNTKHDLSFQIYLYLKVGWHLRRRRVAKCRWTCLSCKLEWLLCFLSLSSTHMFFFTCSFASFFSCWLALCKRTIYFTGMWRSEWMNEMSLTSSLVIFTTRTERGTCISRACLSTTALSISLVFGRFYPFALCLQFCSACFGLVRSAFIRWCIVAVLCGTYLVGLS